MAKQEAENARALVHSAEALRTAQDKEVCAARAEVEQAKQQALQLEARVLSATEAAEQLRVKLSESGEHKCIVRVDTERNVCIGRQ